MGNVSEQLGADLLKMMVDSAKYNPILEQDRRGSRSKAESSSENIKQPLEQPS